MKTIAADEEGRKNYKINIWIQNNTKRRQYEEIMKYHEIRDKVEKVIRNVRKES